MEDDKNQKSSEERRKKLREKTNNNFDVCRTRRTEKKGNNTRSHVFSRVVTCSEHPKEPQQRLHQGPDASW